MFLLDWFYGLLASLGLRLKVAKIFFLGVANTDKLLHMLKDEMEQPSSSPTAPWSDLSPDLLRLVFLHLSTRADRAHFRAVCRQWRSSMKQGHLPPMSPMPWSLLPGGDIVRFSRDQTFQLPEATHHHNSCGEWLLLSRDDNSCFMLNPFTNATVHLPSLSSYINYDEHVETINVPDDETAATWMDIKDLSNISVITLIVCSKHLIAVIVDICGLGTIALCRPGAAAWSVSAHVQCMWLSDMVFFQGKLYAINTNEDLLSIDIVDELDNDRPRVSRIEHIIEGELQPPQCYPDSPDSMLYLLESHGTLLMVRRKMEYMVDMYETKASVSHSAGSREFQVLEADLKRLLWAEVRSLGNEVALFIGQGCSSAVHVSPYDLSWDCIFFMKDYSGCTDGMRLKTRTYCGLYDMKDGMVYSLLWMVSWKSGVGTTWLFSDGKIDKLLTTKKKLQELVEPPATLATLLC